METKIENTGGNTCKRFNKELFEKVRKALQRNCYWCKEDIPIGEEVRHRKYGTISNFCKECFDKLFSELVTQEIEIRYTRKVLDRACGVLSGAVARNAFIPNDYRHAELVRMCARMFMIQKKTGERYSIDHILPIEKGGFHHHLNIQIMPLSLNNSKKSNLDWRHPDYKSWIDLPIELIPEHLHTRYHSERASRILNFDNARELLAA